MSDTEQIDKLFLELSQFTKATTAKELSQQAEITRLNAIIAEMQKVDDLLAPQEWISVDDRFPEFIKQDNHPTEPMRESALVLTYNDGIYNFDRCFQIGEGRIKFFISNCSHWKPLPPKP